MPTAYATVDDLVSRYGESEIIELTDRDHQGAIDAAIAGQALDDANAEVDSYLATRYPVPPDPVPTLLARVACDIARYRLYDDAAPEEVRKRYDDAARILARLASGEISIGPAQSTPTHPQTVTVVGGTPAVFGRRPNGGLR